MKPFSVRWLMTRLTSSIWLGSSAFSFGATYLVENVGARVHCSRLVVEAKRDKSYTVSEALSELAEARANRDAGVGVFVMSKRSNA